MNNLWEFLLQTMEVSLAAIFILLLKEMFRDKLSPRWQYGVWSILGVKLLLPAGILNTYMSLDFTAMLQVFKMKIESPMESQFSDGLADIHPMIGIPMPAAAPQSFTDWLFVIYTVGVLASAAYYLLGYIRLRMILKKAWTPAEETLQRAVDLCESFRLRLCSIRILDGIDSAFICGFFRPVLIIPAQQEEGLDEKIILHELLHWRYFDLWQNGFWSLMRCIHWCNPLLQHVFNCIGNDMESLCDQRVLERIRGEERRDYGRILLAMTNQKYARALGTTSLSNGGSNIRKRIEAIARFKKYPQGMALAAVCICLMAAVPVFGGTRQSVSFADSDNLSSVSPVALTKYHLQGCTTVAGAIDTYTKGMIYREPAYLSMVLSGEQYLFAKDIAENSTLRPAYDGCYVLNLQTEKDGSMESYIMLYTDESGFASGEPPYEVTAMPVRVSRENHRWIVTANGRLIQYRTGDLPQWNYQHSLPAAKSYQADSGAGVFCLEEQTSHYIMTGENDDAESSVLEQPPNPDTFFSQHQLHYVVDYQHDMTKEKWCKAGTAALSARVLTDENPKPNWIEDSYPGMTKDEYGSGDGTARKCQDVDENWLGDLQMNVGFFEHERGLTIVKGYAVRTYINNVPGKTVFIERRQTNANEQLQK